MNFKWENKSDNKDGSSNKGFDPRNPPKLGPRHYILLSIVGFLFAQSMIEYYYDQKNITYVVSIIHCQIIY